MNRLPKMRYILVSLYFLNLLLIYRYAPVLIIGEKNLSGLTYLWAWAILSIFFYFRSELNKLFYIPGLKKKGGVKPNLFTLMFQSLLRAGLIPAILLIVYADFFLIKSFLDKIL